MMVPLTLLYEMSIVLSRVVWRRRVAAEAAAGT
jgi:Sec-independent protein secretion pathway component TatC